MRYRQKGALDQEIPITNYGIAIAHMRGILKRSTQMLPQVRKILEKHGWSERAAERILNAYSARRPLDEGEIETLRLYLSYPWKYWKLANHYYTHNKAVISGKNVEKLRTLIHQKKQWEEFSKQWFRQ